MSAGLFTADTADPLWKCAHDILLPTFSTSGDAGLLARWSTSPTSCMLKWERLNPGEPVDVTADMTRLTLDTIALCGFGYRFNSFYRDTQHPFVEAMIGVARTRARRGSGCSRSRSKLAAAPSDASGEHPAHGRQVEQIIARAPRASGDAGHRTCSATCSPGTDKQGNTLPTTTSSRSASRS